jgi:hypothetical protein
MPGFFIHLTLPFTTEAIVIPECSYRGSRSKVNFSSFAFPGCPLRTSPLRKHHHSKGKTEW